MAYKDDTAKEGWAQESTEAARSYRESLQRFLGPLLKDLDQRLDKRLVRTFAGAIESLIRFRDRARGLLLSELGAQLLTPEHGPAGTKRLSNLLRSKRWSAELLETFLWQRADWRLRALEAQGKDALVVWDESEMEKAESLKAEGLCAVRSRKAARLKHIKPGYYNPPGGRPIFVPGLHWLGILLLGWQGPPTLAAMRWWTTRGARASDRRSEEFAVLQQCAHAWGPRVLHVWDRGFAGNPWLSLVLNYHLRFVLRWPKRYHLVDAQGQERPAWQIARGKRTWASFNAWDTHHQQWRKTGVLALPVKHPEHSEQLWLVVSRPGQGRSPWYLLTNEPVLFSDDAWQIVTAYSRRWQIEMTWRYSKSELAMESPRLWFWENRTKLLLMVSLAYAFLLSLLDPLLQASRDWLLSHWCHRTGKRSRKTLAPLYRLRSALSALWLAHPAHLPLYANSG